MNDNTSLLMAPKLDDTPDAVYAVRPEVNSAKSNVDAAARSLSWYDFAQRYFQDKSHNNHCYQRRSLLGPLLKQVWGDGDSTRMLSVWVTILRFLGDLPSRTDEPLTNLQKLHLICNIALSRPNTRDEIYCQILKQLTENSNKPSHARGWILLALCVGCFLPSESFLGVLKKFINNGPPLYAPFVLARLARTHRMGIRSRPPCSLEMQAAFTKKGVPVEIHFYLGSIIVEIDSATIAAEIGQQLFTHTGIRQGHGFSLYICSPDFAKMTPIGIQGFKVMDGMFEYEESGMTAGLDWRDLDSDRPWTMVFRKQRFAPWPESTDNLDLVYGQILDGLRRGIYTIHDETDMVTFLAKRYYIEVSAYA